MGRISHGESLFSFDGVDASRKGNDLLTRFFESLIENSKCVVCLSERPLLNESVKSLVNNNGSVISQLQDVKYDDFELSFSYRKGLNKKLIIKFLSDCFQFFEHPAFIFLSRESDVEGCRKFCSESKNWKGVIDSFESCFAFKSVEDDVLWYKVSSNFQENWLISDKF